MVLPRIGSSSRLLEVVVYFGVASRALREDDFGWTSIERLLWKWPAAFIIDVRVLVECTNPGFVIFVT